MLSSTIPWYTGLEKYPALYAVYQKMQVTPLPEPEATTFVAQPLEVGAKEFREGFVQNGLYRDRALAVAAIALCALVFIVLFGASDYLAPGMAGFGRLCKDLTAIPLAIGLFTAGLQVDGSVAKLNKKDRAEWFADNKRSLRGIYYQNYYQRAHYADEGIAPAVHEGVLTISEGEKLSSLIKQYREFSDKACPAAKWLESQWVAFLDAASAPAAIDVDPMVLGMHYLEHTPTVNGTDNPSVDSLETFLE